MRESPHRSREQGKQGASYTSGVSKVGFTRPARCSEGPFRAPRAPRPLPWCRCRKDVTMRQKTVETNDHPFNEKGSLCVLR